jgi:hypothetical protein
MRLASWLELFDPLEVSSRREVSTELSLAMVSSQQLQREAGTCLTLPLNDSDVCLGGATDLSALPPQSAASDV